MAHAIVFVLLSSLGAQTTQTPGMVVAWGSNSQGKANVPVGLNAIALASGGSHGLALKPDGNVAVWGSFNARQTIPAGLSNVIAISAGYTHSLALKSDGSVLAWGGDNEYSQTDVPAELAEPSTGFMRVTGIVSGHNHSLARRHNGAVIAWGDNSSGQTDVPADLMAYSIAAGVSHSLAIRVIPNGVVAWGDNSSGQTDVPEGLNSIIAVAAGESHSLALKSDGTVVAWGSNAFGQTAVPAGLTDVIAIGAGALYSLALKNDGTIVAWGNNSFGEIDVPEGLSGVTAIAAGWRHGMALLHEDFLQISPETADVAASGGDFNLSVQSDSSTLTWSMVRNGDWITLPVSSITGSGTVEYQVAPNNSTSSRTGSIEVGNKSLEVTQSGASLTLPISSASSGPEGGSFSFEVQADSSALSWNISRSRNWISLKTNAGIGNGTVAFQVDINNSSTTRSATIQVLGQTFEINQSGVVPTYEVSVSLDSFPASGGSGTLSVISSLADAEWTFQKPEWISMSGSSFTGSRSRNFTVLSNTSPGTRTGVIEAAGHSITITQAGTGGVFYDELAASPQQGGGWIQSDWLGSAYISRFPWVFVETLGWIRIHGTTTDDFWFYKPEGQFGFGHTGKSFFPNLYYARGQRWLRNTRGDRPVFFYDYDRSAERSLQDVVGVLSFSLSELRHSYSVPYLLDFNFKLTDHDGLPVTLDPAEFTIEPLEAGSPISPSETGFQLLSADDKQLRVFIVLDYTRSIASPDYGDSTGNGISDAIEEMEAAAKKFIDSLPDGAQIGIIEFHREDRNPGLVSDFTTRKDNLKAAIDRIWVDFVQFFPAASRSWDAVTAAINAFGSSTRTDEQRYVVFLSDGVDESSSSTPSTIRQQANQAGVRIFSIGFGNELDDTALKQITQQTGGAYFEAGGIEALSTAFEGISLQLKGNYLLRWATLKRNAGQTFTPSFRITHNSHTIYQQSGMPQYNPVSYAGDVLNGQLTLVTDAVAAGAATTTVRVAYAPRYIRQIRLQFQAAAGVQLAFERIAEEDTGLIPSDWSMEVQEQGSGQYVVHISSPQPNNINTSLPYASLGPLLRVISTGISVSDEAFFNVSVDNTLYNVTGGQFWAFE